MAEVAPGTAARWHAWLSGHVRALLVGAMTGLVLLAPGSAAADAQGPTPAAINVPLFSQQDNLWKSHELGTCASDTLGSAGCAVISVAMVYAKYGVVLSSTAGVGMNPDILNAWLRDNGRYGADAGGGLCDIQWWRLPAGVQYTGSDTSGARLNAELAAGRPVIARVHNTKMPMHFVVITGQHGATYDINDPLSLTRRQLDDGSPDAYIVDTFHYFRPSPASATTTAYRVSAAKFWGRINPATGLNTDIVVTVLLADGRVLLLTSSKAAPGKSAPRPLTAHIFDSTSGTFTAAGSMLDGGMTAPSATLLPDGRVLFVGDGATPEIYNPGKGSFARTAPLVCPRCVGRTATLLSDGRVLLAGGYIPASANAAPDEIYDPANDQFTYTGPMISGRTNAGTLLLPDGRVLFVGGLALRSSSSANEPSAAIVVEIYDPATWLFTAIGNLPTARIAPNLSLAPGGQVLVNGGYDLAGEPVSEGIFFDLASGDFSSTPAGPSSAS